MLKDPETTVKDFAMTQIPRCCSKCKDTPIRDVRWEDWEVCKGHNRVWNRQNDKVLMGYSLRTDQWRYIIWMYWDTQGATPLWDQGIALDELYDHRDPRCNEKSNFDLCETINVASDGSLKSVKDELYKQIREIVDHYNFRAWTTESNNAKKKV